MNTITKMPGLPEENAALPIEAERLFKENIPVVSSPMIVLLLQRGA
jgi:hypothetical protein